MNAERFGNAIENINRRIFRLALKTGQVGTVDPSRASQSFLRHTTFEADPTDVPGQ
ncbi:hypothetical protein GGD62_008079 [Bradyrhizobium sp. ERR14]|nr:hypothetical protein [Bradyrhizobium sp. ERR14]